MMNEDFIQRYTNDVYHARDPEAPARFIADPCLRHEAGELVTLSLADNKIRIAEFLDKQPGATFVLKLVAGAGEYVTACYEAHLGGDQTISGIEVFRVVEDKIVETWNSVPVAGAWG
jgi:predicted SnoaL-like aldol condensation-catalyzing enzyme